MRMGRKPGMYRCVCAMYGIGCIVATSYVNLAKIGLTTMRAPEWDWERALLKILQPVMEFASVDSSVLNPG